MSRESAACVRVGVVGLGYWGPNFVRNIADSCRAELSWLCDANPQRSIAWRASTPRRETSLDLDELFSDPRLDAVVDRDADLHPPRARR